MNYNHPLKSNSTLTIRVTCAIVFISFAFSWLYFFQADLLSVAQHVISQGMTSYHPLVGTLIIVFVLQMLQLMVYTITRLKKRSHAFTYVPSMLALALLTNVSILSSGEVVSSWHWFLPVGIMVLWVLVTLVARLFQEVENDAGPSLFSRHVWVNMLLMCLQMMCVAWISNTNAVNQYRLKTETLLSAGNYQEALRVGDQSLESDADLMMLRMYGLARENALGERLFEYPISGTSSQILPTNGQTSMIYCSTDSLWRFLGGRPAGEMEPMRYLELLARRDSIVSRPVADYRLCGLLIDRQLDRFAQEVRNYYALDEHLPRHYREALVLYTHSRSNPLFVYRHAVTEEDWRNLQELERKYPDDIERKGRVEDQYSGTYWYYYEYEK